MRYLTIVELRQRVYPRSEFAFGVDFSPAYCRQIGNGYVDGCSGLQAGACIIIVPSDGPDSDLSPYRRHEIVHCNGWPPNHVE